MTTATGRGRLAIFEPDAGTVPGADIGGKALGLLRIEEAGLATPPWFAVLPGAVGPDETMSDVVRLEVTSAIRRLETLGARSFAVRSSARDEDQVERSYAGQYRTELDVRGIDHVIQAIASVVASSRAAGADAYRAAHQDGSDRSAVSVIVQSFVQPALAGVAFSRDPLTGADEVVITATRLLPGALSVGESTGDEYRVLPPGQVIVLRPDPEDGPDRILSDEQVRALAGVARRLERRADVPQDLEWLFTDLGELHILQARPITALPLLAPAGDPVRLWDNANIVESFPDLTLPLTFSVAVTVYATVYRRACLALGVPPAAITRESDAFDEMLGLLQGRVYYNLGSWYRVLALLPGFRLTAGFMESMMGARQPGSSSGERSTTVMARAARRVEIGRMVARLGVRRVRLDRDIARFEATIRTLVARSAGASRSSPSAGALLAEFTAFRDAALRHWAVPIMNDLFLMLAHGALRRVAGRWLGDDGQALVTGLLASGDVASARPGAELLEIASAIRDRHAWRDAVLATSPERLRATLAADPTLSGAGDLIDGYLSRWGDHAPRELQLERQSYREDPVPLLRALSLLVSHPPERQSEDADDPDVDLRRRLPGPVGSVRLAIVHRLVRATRRHIRWREELRQLRGQVFGVGRRIFRRLGAVLSEQGVLQHPEDVHYLALDELEALVRGGAADDARALVRQRRERYEAHASEPRLPRRFETRGPLTDPLVIAALGPVGESSTGAWRGIGAARGRVRGQCLVVEDPARTELLPGRIIAARSTDPGWVPLLVTARGLVVEQGSLLSHSAIVARELGIPTVVGLTGLLDAVRTGDTIELDGSTGEVRLLPGIRGDP